MLRIHRTLLSLALAAPLSSGLSACQSTSRASTTEPVSSTAEVKGAPRPVLGSFGFDVSGMDRSVAPGDDFYGYANGTWVARTEIPPDRSTYNSFTRIALQTEQQVREIIEGAANDAEASSDLRKVGDYYTAFMDEQGIEAKGLAPVQEALQAISAIDSKKALSLAFGKALRADVDLLNMTDFYTDRPFGVWVSQDLNDPSRNVPYLVQGGLGMPDRSYYLEASLAKTREAYQGHVAKVLELAGIPDAQAKAARIVALETAIAKVHATQEQTNDVQAGANPWKRADFEKKAAGLDWPAFMDAAGLQDQQDFIVWQPAAIAGMSKLVASQPLSTWKEYLTFHTLDRASPFLPKAFADEHFAFHGNTLYGIPQQRERWKRAVSVTNDALGEAVGKQYVERYVDAATKTRAEEMVRHIVTAFGQRIDALDWMTPETKAQAKKKVERLQVAIGFPEKWRDYGALEVKADDAHGNAERAELFEYHRNLRKLREPVTHDEWYMNPQTVNALNVPLENRLIFPAAILQAPFFDPNADDAVNYGAMGAVIGHEITHSFDNIGALFDAHGRLHNWWTSEDMARFEAAGQALAVQFSRYKPFEDLAVNGKLTLGENIADVAGLATAYDGYVLSQQGREPQAIDGFTPDQRFFLGYAQTWRSKYREATLRNVLLTDVHAPGQYRALTVRNLDAWYPAFDVKEGQQLYLAPKDRVKVW